MRLWHKDLISVLPRQQLLGQWRECCLIAKNIAEKGTPNHLLVDKIMNYPIEHFWFYTNNVSFEMRMRGYHIDEERFLKWYRQIGPAFGEVIESEDIFKDWHNNRYLCQCLANLEEKYDCGGISEAEWRRVVNKHSIVYYSIYGGKK